MEKCIEDVSEHFNRSEFACRCGCGFDTIDTATLAALENIRDYFGQPITINSACRCINHNTQIGGAARSQHIFARASDIVVKDVTPADVADYATEIGLSVGRYSTFTHIDTRSGPTAYWFG